MQNKIDTKSSRVAVFDLLRIISVIIVVNLHIRIIAYTKPNSLESLAYYAVPLFLVLSFYLMSKYLIKRTDHHVFLLRIKRILIPLIFWSFIGFMVHPNVLSVNNILLQLVTGEVVNVPLYYLNLLLIFTSILWLLTFVATRFRLILYSGIVLLAFFLEYSSINYQFFSQTILAIKNSYGRFVELIPYAVIGIGFGYLQLKMKRKSWGLLAVALLFSLIYIFSINLPQPLGFHYSGITIFSGIVAFFSITLLLSGLQFNSMLYQLIEVLGKYSFGVYLFHFILLEFLLKIFPQTIVYINRSSLLFLIFYVFFCYGLCILFNFLTRKKLAFLFM